MPTTLWFLWGLDWTDVIMRLDCRDMKAGILLKRTAKHFTPWYCVFSISSQNLWNCYGNRKWLQTSLTQQRHTNWNPSSIKVWLVGFKCDRQKPPAISRKVPLESICSIKTFDKWHGLKLDRVRWGGKMERWSINCNYCPLCLSIKVTVKLPVEWKPRINQKFVSICTWLRSLCTFCGPQSAGVLGSVGPTVDCVGLQPLVQETWVQSMVGFHHWLSCGGSRFSSCCRLTALVSFFLVLSCFSLFQRCLTTCKLFELKRAGNLIGFDCGAGYLGSIPAWGHWILICISKFLLLHYFSPGGWNALHVHRSSRVCRVSCVFGLILRQTSLNFSTRQSQRHGTRCWHAWKQAALNVAFLCV